MKLKFELTQKNESLIGYKINDGKNGDIGICYGEYRDNNDDVILNISIVDNKYLEEVYEFISHEIFIHFEAIQNIYTEVYKSDQTQLDFFHKNDFVIFEDESEMYPKIVNPLLLLKLQI